MLYLVIFGEKFSSNSPKISKKKLVTHLDEIRSTLTEHEEYFKTPSQDIFVYAEGWGLRL